MKKYFIVLLFLINAAYADDTQFGGQGANPMPIEQGNVKMAAEKIIVNGVNIDDTKLTGRWDFNCLYTFQNTTAKPLQFTMGFPFPVYNDMSPISVPAGMKVKNGSPLVYEFKVAIDNKPVVVQHTKLAPNTLKGLYYNDAYKWNVSFKPNQTLNITHHYITGVTYDVMAHHWLRFVLRTGGLWQSGIIGRVQFEINPNTPTELCSVIDPQFAKSFKPTPDGMKIVGEGVKRKYLWDITNLRPEKDVNLCLVTGQDYVKSTVVLPIIYNSNNAVKDLTKNSCAALGVMKNTIYAQYGKKFNDTTLQNYFNKQWWYLANASYSDKLLTQEDLKVVAAINTAESTNKCS